MNLERVELGCFGCEKAFKMDRKQFMSIGDSEIRAGVKIFEVKFRCTNCGKVSVYCLSEDFMTKYGIFDWKLVKPGERIQEIQGSSGSC